MSSQRAVVIKNTYLRKFRISDHKSGASSCRHRYDVHHCHGPRRDNRCVFQNNFRRRRYKNMHLYESNYEIWIDGPKSEKPLTCDKCKGELKFQSLTTIDQSTQTPSQNSNLESESQQNENTVLKNISISGVDKGDANHRDTVKEASLSTENKANIKQLISLQPIQKQVHFDSSALTEPLSLRQEYLYLHPNKIQNDLINLSNSIDAIESIIKSVETSSEDLNSVESSSKQSRYENCFNESFKNCSANFADENKNQKEQKCLSNTSKIENSDFINEDINVRIDHKVEKIKLNSKYSIPTTKNINHGPDNLQLRLMNKWDCEDSIHDEILKRKDNLILNKTLQHRNDGKPKRDRFRMEDLMRDLEDYIQAESFNRKRKTLQTDLTTTNDAKCNGEFHFYKYGNFSLPATPVRRKLYANGRSLQNYAELFSENRKRVNANQNQVKENKLSNALRMDQTKSHETKKTKNFFAGLIDRLKFKRTTKLVNSGCVAHGKNEESNRFYESSKAPTSECDISRMLTRNASLEDNILNVQFNCNSSSGYESNTREHSSYENDCCDSVRFSSS